MTTEIARQAEGESPFKGIVPDRSVEQMRQDVEAGLKYLADCASGEIEEPNPLRIKAIEVLLDRYYGKPTQRRDTETKGGSVQNITRQLNIVIAGEHSDTINAISQAVSDAGRQPTVLAERDDRLPGGGDQSPRRSGGERPVPPGTA